MYSGVNTKVYIIANRVGTTRKMMRLQFIHQLKQLNCQDEIKYEISDYRPYMIETPREDTDKKIFFNELV